MSESFYLTDDQRMIRDLARKIARERIAPHAAHYDETETYPEASMRAIVDSGLFGIWVPEEYGGSAMGCLALSLVSEEIAAACASTATQYLDQPLGGLPILLAGSEEQKKKYLPRLATGDLLSAYSLSEPGAGSDAGGLRTTAVRKGDHYILNGSKQWCTNGDHADVVTVFATVDPSKRAKGVTAFLVEKGTPGFTVGRSLRKTGWLSSDTAELVFENVRIPEENLLGEEGKGFYAVMKNFQTERIALGAMAIGHCTQALRITLDHVRQRQAFGATLWDQQTIRQRISMLDAKVRAARQFMYHCAWSVTQGHDIVQEVSMLKALTGELVNEVVQTCQQFHGGMGYIRETAIERLWRDARVLAIGGGATEVMLEEVAKRY